MIEVTVDRLGRDPGTNAHVVVLVERGGTRTLPIWIGAPEADAIAAHLQGLKPPRPMTHDLLATVVKAMGGTVRRVQVVRVASDTFFAELHVARQDQLLTIDARPSDAIALAVRLAAPIYVHAALLSSADGDADATSDGLDDEPPPPSGGDEAEKLQDYLQRLRPEDFGKFNI